MSNDVKSDTCKDWSKQDELPENDVYGDENLEPKYRVVNYFDGAFLELINPPTVQGLIKQCDEEYQKAPLHCTCGARSTYGEVPVKMHQYYCDLIRKANK